MAATDIFYTFINNYKNQQSAKEREKSGYQAKANAIAAIYQDLAEDRGYVAGYRTSVQSYMGSAFVNFQGNLYNEKYIAKMETLLSRYDTVLTNIDTNLERLLAAQRDYESKASACSNVISWLQSCINALYSTIQSMLE